ncbi:MAG: HD domain-containing protein [Clostridiales bacterium]|nr:HD domain-containing protein [Clostridiales bacterium]
MKTLTPDQEAEIENRVKHEQSTLSPYATRDNQAVRFFGKVPHDVLRSQFATDADRIINCKFFNRCGDKTQVFSFRKNDDITRRSSHVQLVSRIARKIGRALGLNLDLIEAIAIGHDIGHTPFGHAGESILSELYRENAGKLFNHNVHSVRVLNLITRNNLTAQTLDGIICHCGEKVDERYEPNTLPDKSAFFKMFDSCYTDENAIKRLRPSTLEGCVVRLSDMVAYMGKDRQDALYSVRLDAVFDETVIGSKNRDIISNVTQDVIANSLDKPYLSLSRDVFEALEHCKDENNEKIYRRPEVRRPYDEIIRPMMRKMYFKLLTDLENKDEESIIYRHYLFDEYIYANYFGENNISPELFAREPNDVVVDFIASMSDDYLLDAFAFLFPNDKLNDKVRYVGYFDK